MSLTDFFANSYYFNAFRSPPEVTLNLYHLISFIIVCCFSKNWVFAILICVLFWHFTLGLKKWFLNKTQSNQLFLTSNKVNSCQKPATVSFEWSFTDENLRFKGSLKSEQFGTEATKFYFIAEQKAKDFSLNLYLAVCNRSKLLVDVSVSSPENRAHRVSKRTTKGGMLF